MRRIAFVLALALALAACGDDATPAERALAEAADNLADVRSGSLRLKVAAATSKQPDREVGFELEGPFALAEEKGTLPEVRFALTDLLGAQTRKATFVSDGERASVEQDGRTVEVDDDAVRHLRGRAEATEGLTRLHVDEWVRAPRREADGRIVGDVDVVNALNDVLAVAADVGADPQDVGRIEGDAADRLQRSVRSSRIEVLVDDELDVVRSVRMLVAFGTHDDLAPILGRLAGVRLMVEMDLGGLRLRDDDS